MSVLTLDDHIKKAEEDAVQAEFDSDWGIGNYLEALEYAKNCRQLAEWLKELKQLREQSRWIPISERLPEPQKHGDEDFSDWVEVTILIGKYKDAYVVEHIIVSAKINGTQKDLL